MTAAEARIRIIDRYNCMECVADGCCNKCDEAFDLAIEALELMAQAQDLKNRHLYCLQDECDSRGGEECDRCESAFLRGYRVGVNENK